MSPRVSVVIPGADGDAAVLRTVASIRSQHDDDVEVILGGNRGYVLGEETARLLEAGRKRATGDFIGVLGPGDELEPGALAAVLMMLDHRTDLDVLYTDEQWAAAAAAGIATKPDYSPHYLAGYPYLGRLCLVRADVVTSAGGFRPGFEGVEEWDLHLRVAELTDRIGHLPVVAVTRAAPPRTDQRAQTSARRAVEARLARSGHAGTVEATPVPLGMRIWWAPDDPPLVSIVIPTAGGRRTVDGQDLLLVEHCVESLLQTTYERWELVLVTSEHTPPTVVPRIRELVGDRLVHAPIAGSFNFSASINEGARLARGEHLLLLNDDTAVCEPRWLERMVSVATGDGVGAVGAKLLFGNGTIQHVGVIMDDEGVPIHALGSERDGLGRFGTKELDVDYLAVTGACLLTPVDVFCEVGGFSEDLPLNYNDVDYCLKVGGRGLAVVSTPFARLFHYASSTRGETIQSWEQDWLDRHWPLRLSADPHVEFRRVL